MLDMILPRPPDFQCYSAQEQIQTLFRILLVQVKGGLKDAAVL